VLGRYAASAFELSPVANWLALGTQSGGIQVVDLDTNATISRMEGHRAVIYELAFSPDGQELVSASEDCSIRSWEVRTGKFSNYYADVSVNAYVEDWSKSRIFVYNLQVLGNRQLVGFGSWGTAASWNLDSGALKYVVGSEALKYYEGMVTIKPHFPESFWLDQKQGSFFINGSPFSIADGKPGAPIQLPASQAKACYSGGVLSKDGKVTFSLGFSEQGGEICVLDARSGELLWRVGVAQPNIGQYIGGLYLSPDGTRLYVPMEDGIVFVYQVGARP
jgi:WD40 repeat protein